MIRQVTKCFQRQLVSQNLRFFASLPVDIDFTQFTTIFRKVERNDDHTFIIEADERVEFTMEEQCTVKDLIDQLKKHSPEIKNCTAYSLDRAEIAGITILDDIQMSEIYLLVNNVELFKVVSLDSTQALENEKMYQNLENYCDSIGVPFLERKIVLNYIKRFDLLNKGRLSKNLLTDKDYFDKPFDKQVLIDTMVEGLANNRNQQIDNEEQLYHQFNALKDRLDIMKIQRAEIEAKAHKRAKYKMLIGLAALVGQFSFVGVGTYIVWSWDIIEPMVYFLNLAATGVLSYQFFKTYKDYSNTSFLKYIKDKELKKLYVRENFPIDEVINLEREVEALEKLIKSNVIINL